MDIDQHRFFSNKYDWISCLLGYFLEDTYLDLEKPENLSPKEFGTQLDLGTIKRYIETFEAKYIMETIKQGREILALEEFPSKWIADTCNFSYPTIEEHKEWVTWVIDELEKHAKIAGKFVTDNPIIQEENNVNKTISKDNKDLKLPGFELDSGE
ncbi:hypothetical protein NOVO_08365 [Rickettsiales bacterium Ac37b]|nr:hypothetical protein NOVO_01905 [Rickettsiales bacterium Ac37b]AIL65996.1 hypothetical protein NOVO_08365 [Rickettsiales bacterium Ac37b]